MLHDNDDIDGEKIKEIIKLLIDNPSRSGFGVFVVMKSEPKLKKMGFWEGAPTQSSSEGNLKARLKEMVLHVLLAKFAAQEIEYVSADMIADNQQKFYMVPVSESYNPFSFLANLLDIPLFSQKDIEDAAGIVFKVTIAGNTSQLSELFLMESTHNNVLKIHDLYLMHSPKKLPKLFLAHHSHFDTAFFGEIFHRRVTCNNFSSNGSISVWKNAIMQQSAEMLEINGLRNDIFIYFQLVNSSQKVEIHYGHISTCGVSWSPTNPKRILWRRSVKWKREIILKS